ncbi:M1 family metallopeptidase [Nitrospira sp. Kam-Ns4a]
MRPAVVTLLAGLLLLSGRPAGAAPPRPPDPAASADIELETHDLSVELMPETHGLRATDRLSLRVRRAGLPRVVFTLNPALEVHQVAERRGAETRPLAFRAERHRTPGPPGEAIQQVAVELGRPVARDERLVLEWAYGGAVNEPPREPRHLRFVTPSETAGHIGPEGVYLSGETHWYPDRPGSLATFSVRIMVPAGWEAVTHGREVARSAVGRTTTTEWEVAAKTEALTLAANRFVKAQRVWTAASGQTIVLATYLFPEDASLADEYLDASARYLEAYTKLLGPYPFPKFAVVENFFASGLGMPSFTLLGSGVIKRHYVQAYALGHEIVHSWLGNWVLNDLEAGNWVEGLTTYLANYYYEELTGPPAQARDQRRLMLYGYAVYVPADEDYAVREFRRKSSQRDNAIGYQKCAMIFHMLRREIGDDAFWRGVRALVAAHGGAYAGWPDLERAFAAAAGRDLRWFFAQWVERPGAPHLRLVEARVTPAAGPTGGFIVSGRISQTRPTDGSAAGVSASSPARGYRLRVPLTVHLAGGTVDHVVVEVAEDEQPFRVSVEANPLRLVLDADFEVFRRLDRAQLPPMLNLFVTDRPQSVVLPDHGPEAERAPYHALAARLAAQDPDGGAGGPPRLVPAQDWGGRAAEGSVLVLGGPEINRAVAWAGLACGERVRIERDRFTVGEQVYREPTMALLVSCRHPDRPGSVVTLFYGLTPGAAAKVARLLFFYGWQSYLVFRDGAVIARGDFPAADGEEAVRFHTP